MAFSVKVPAVIGTSQTPIGPNPSGGERRKTVRTAVKQGGGLSLEVAKQRVVLVCDSNAPGLFP